MLKLNHQVLNFKFNFNFKLEFVESKFNFNFNFNFNFKIQRSTPLCFEMLIQRVVAQVHSYAQIQFHVLNMESSWFKVEV